MKRNIIITALAGAAIAISAPALAKPGGGNGGGNGKGGATAGATTNGRMGGGASAGGMVGTDMNSTIGSSISTRGNGGASATSRGHMNSGSAIDMRGSTAARAGSTATVGTRANSQLSGVTGGMSVVDSGGATVGTVTGVTARGNGSARTVQVTLTDGTIINLDARSLTLDGNVLTTNSLETNVRSQGAAHASINGLAHASPKSALNSAGVTTLTGLTTGLTVNDGGGMLVGTVDSVITNRAGAVVGIRVALDGGGTVTLPATGLSMDGTTVVTTSVTPHP